MTTKQSVSVENLYQEIQKMAKKDVFRQPELPRRPVKKVPRLYRERVQKRHALLQALLRARRAVANFRMALVVLAIYQLGYSFIWSYLSGQILAVILAMPYVFFVIYSKKAPLPAFSLAGLFYVLTETATIMVDPASLMQGLGLKLVFLGLLAVGAYWSHEEARLNDEMDIVRKFYE